MSLCRTMGEVWCPVKRRNAFTLKTKPSGVRSAQSCALAGAGIPSKLSDGGATVQVPSSKVNEARVAAGKAGVGSSRADWSLLDKSSLSHEKLGLAVRPLSPDEKQEVGHGGLVVENASGPAALAGIQPGDVIVSVGSAKVTTVEGLKQQVDKAGRNIALLIERNGQKIFVPVRVG